MADLDEQVELYKEQLAALRTELENLKAQADAGPFDSLSEGMQKQADLLGKLTTSYQANKAELQALEAATNNAALSEDKRLVAQEKLDAALLHQQELQAQLTQELEKGVDGSEEYTKVLHAMAEGHDVNAAALARADKAQQDYQDNVESGEQAFRGLTDSVLGLSGPLSKVAGFFSTGEGGVKGFTSELKQSIVTGELAANMALKYAESLINFGLEQDRVISNFRASTGAGEEFNDLIRQTERAGFAAGVSLEDAAAAATALKNTFTDFTYLNRDVQDEVMLTTTLLNEMGFSMDIQAGIMQTATQSLGMTVEESSAFMVDMASTARSLGMDVNSLAGQFQGASDFLAGFGAEGTQVFEDLAVQAKSLGMEITQLTQIVDKFTTFDEAGKSVGRLNAILGGPFLNSIDMLNAAMEDPTEAISMLRGSLDDAGVSLEDMSRPEKMAFASALGMSVEDMTNLMGKSSAELEIHRLEQEELAEQAAATKEITEQLSNAFKALLIDMGPLLDTVIKPFVGWIGGLAQSLGNLFTMMGPMKSFFTVMGVLVGTAFGSFLALGGSIAAALAPIPGLGQFSALAFSKAAFKAIGLGVLAGIGGGLLGAGIGSLFGGPSAAPTSGGATKAAKGFASGGIVTGTTTALVGEQGPELVEMPTGSRVTTAPSTKELTTALKKLSSQLSKIDGAPGNIAVYVGDKEVTDVVVRALNSPRGRKKMGAYGV